MQREEQVSLRKWQCSGDIRYAREWLATVTCTIFQSSTAAAEADATAGTAQDGQPPAGSTAWGSVVVARGTRNLPVELPCELHLNSGRTCVVALEQSPALGAGQFQMRFLRPSQLQGM